MDLKIVKASGLMRPGYVPLYLSKNVRGCDINVVRAYYCNWFQMLPTKVEFSIFLDVNEQTPEKSAVFLWRIHNDILHFYTPQTDTVKPSWGSEELRTKTKG